MTGTMDNPEILVPAEVRSPRGLTELVRGNDGRLIEEFSPLVRMESLTLDLAAVERIDAAGIAALIWLYRAAQECGHGFTVFNAAPRVRELLALVGLEEILLSHPSPAALAVDRGLERDAA